MVKTATLQVAKCVEKGLGYQLLLRRLDPKGCGNSASHDTLSFPGPPSQEIPFAAVSRGFPQGVFYQGHPFTEDLHSGSVGMGDIPGTSKLGQQLSHVVLCLLGEGGCVVPATSRRDCKCTK